MAMIEQRSDQWLEARKGKITASRFADAIAFDKRNGKPTEARNSYLFDLVYQITSGNLKDQVTAKALAHGIETEPIARDAYELETGNFVVESEFILHPEFDFIGCSPDGLIDDDGGIEIKSPHNPKVHLTTILAGMPPEHIAQVQGCMFVTGRKYWDFVSYDPRQCDDLRLYVQRVFRDDQYISEVLQPGLIAFWGDVNSKIKELFDKSKNPTNGN